ncbi:MAG: outer membrane protein [Vicinamibacterales bacterium]
MKTLPTIVRTTALALATWVAAANPAAAQPPSRYYVAAAGGVERSRDTRLVDAACDGPDILFFGCQAGTDGQQLGAAGDFGGSPVLELGVGVRLLRQLRAEVAVANAVGYSLEANANFLGAGSQQPATAEMSRLAVMARAIVDLTPLYVWRLEPFVGVGAGVSRQRLSGVTYEFPELSSQPSTTATQGGRWRGAAWDGSAGVALRVTPRARIDVTYRYTDAGHVETDPGTIEVVRGSRTLVIDGVGGTRAALTSHAVLIGIRGTF